MSSTTTSGTPGRCVGGSLAPASVPVSASALFLQTSSSAMAFRPSARACRAGGCRGRAEERLGARCAEWPSPRATWMAPSRSPPSPPWSGASPASRSATSSPGRWRSRSSTSTCRGRASAACGRCTLGVIFAFGGNALLATSLYVVQRTCHARLAGRWSPWFVVWGYQLFIAIAGTGYLLGITQSKEYAEPEWYADLLLTVVWVVYFLVFVGTLARRRSRTSTSRTGSISPSSSRWRCCTSSTTSCRCRWRDRRATSCSRACRMR